MSAPALERARDFVAREGSALDRQRADALTGNAPADPARAALEALQQGDGAFAAMPGHAVGPVRATLEGLWVLSELRIRHAPACERAAVFLGACQAADGSFGDEGEDRATVTGLVGGALGGSPYARPELLAAAGDFLAAGFAPESVQDWDRLAGTAAFFANVDHERGDEILQWCGRELERGFRSGRFGAVATARVFTLCDAVGLPGARLDPGEVIAGVLTEQDADGGWPGADRVAASLDAALALVRLPA